jgi:hypothetical protein
MERGQPHLVSLPGALGIEEPLTTIEPAERVLLAFIGREGQLVIPWHAGCFSYWWHMDARWRHHIDVAAVHDG